MPFFPNRTACFLIAALAAFALAQDKPQTEKDQNAKPQPTILQSITVIAEKAETPLKESSAKVSVISAEQIEKELVNDIRDLVRYEPGVYVVRNADRLGLNGFNIRGIGGNRIAAQIDGIRTAEQFDFGPISIHQFFVDTDTLKSVEIVRGAASSLYGSDALGGTVAFRTKDPGDYLGDTPDPYLRFKSGYDGENRGVDFGLAAAWTSGRLQTLVQANRRDYRALDNQGAIESRDNSRTKPNDIDAHTTQLLAKSVWRQSERSLFRITGEVFRGESLTHVYSLQGTDNLFGIMTNVGDSRADDTRDRTSFSLDRELRDAGNPLFDELTWKLYLSANDTRQRTGELRETAAGDVTSRIQRTASLDFEQRTFGADLHINRFLAGPRGTHRLTYGLSWDRTRFSQIRDRRDLDLNTGDPDAYRGPLVFPSRYFPNSDVDTVGVYVQDEGHFLEGKLKLVPGIRYDRSALRPDNTDPIYLAGTQSEEPPVPADHDAVSPKIGAVYNLSRHLALSAQWARGFRAPPYSEVNNGFTNPASGYRTLSNPDLDPETSDNREVGFKAFGDSGSLSLTYFRNDYKNFIELAFLGVDEQNIALYQPLNLTEVRTRGWELAGDTYFTPRWWVKAAISDIEGKDRGSGQPLDSIEPNKAVLGLSHRSAGGRYGGTLNAIFSAAKKREEATGDDPFLPEAYALLDLTFFFRFRDSVSFNLGIFNLGDETYFPWPDVRGRSATEPTIDRYSAPGRNVSLSLTYQWR